MDEVEFAQQVEALKHAVDFGAQHIGQSYEYAHNFAALVDLQFAQAVVGLYNFGRLYEVCFAGCRFIVYNARNLAFVHWRYRNHQSAVAHRRACVGVEVSVFNCASQHTSHS